MLQGFQTVGCLAMLERETYKPLKGAGGLWTEQRQLEVCFAASHVRNVCNVGSSDDAFMSSDGGAKK